VPKPKAFANAFTRREIAQLSGLTLPMVNHLALFGYLQAAYRPGREGRGSPRYYSYRDLVIARLISRLSSAGVELKRLKDSLVDLQRHEMWDALGPSGTLPLLVVSDGRVFLPERDGAIRDLSAGGQLAFAFVLDLAETEGNLLDGMDEVRRGNFSYRNEPLIELRPATA